MYDGSFVYFYQSFQIQEFSCKYYANVIQHFCERPIYEQAERSLRNFILVALNFQNATRVNK